MTVEFLQGNCLEVLKTLEDESVNCCVTSPPYYGLRDYGTSTWEGGDENCDHISYYATNTFHSVYKGDDCKTKNRAFYEKDECSKCGATRIDEQIGLEESPEEYVQKLVEVFREVKRVLKDDGTLWLNIGDSYYSNSRGSGGCSDMQKTNKGSFFRNSKFTKIDDLKPKDLIGIPWRVAFALQADGWYLRQDIIWAKPNPMPESVKDRCTKSHEYIFLLSKKKNYYFDQESIKEEMKESSIKRNQSGWNGNTQRGYVDGKDQNHINNFLGSDKAKEQTHKNKRSVWTVTTKPFSGAHFACFPPDLIEPCILAGCPEYGTVLDPFGGSGTTGMVAEKNTRNSILIELNPEYIKIAKKRNDNVNLFL